VQGCFTALYVSAEFGHVEVARLLLEGKADIHAALQVRRGAQGMRTACESGATRMMPLRPLYDGIDPLYDGIDGDYGIHSMNDITHHQTRFNNPNNWLANIQLKQGFYNQNEHT
jgi:hypothetical protein